jgi:hypothetical protein
LGVKKAPFHKPHWSWGQVGDAGAACVPEPREGRCLVYSPFSIKECFKKSKMRFDLGLAFLIVPEVFCAK